MLRIRPAQPEDAARVVEMSAGVSAAEGLGGPAVTAEMIVRLAFDERLLHVFVAEAERGLLVGHVIATRSFDVQEGTVTHWLADLFVEPAFRGRGVGRRLVGAVAERALAEGAAYVVWLVTPGNRLAERFYAGLGARRDGGVPMFLGREEMTRLAEANRPP